MINLKNNRGITLISEVITVTILLMLITIISYSSMSSLQVKRLNNMYADIVNIQEKAANYYLKYGEAPVDTTKPVSVLLVSADQINENDEADQYYRIDFSKLLNVSLNNKETAEEYYFMNAKTLTTYHSDGVTIENLNGVNAQKTYYTILSNYENVSEIDYTIYQTEI